MSDEQQRETVTPWRAGERRELARTRVMTLYEQRFECVDHPERSGDFTVIDCADWVNVVALTPGEGGERSVVMVEQFRYGTAEVTLEIPGGVIDPGEDPVEAGVRELLEETGYRGARARLLGRNDANPAIMTNRAYTILVEDAEQVGGLSLDEHEQIVVREARVGDLPGMVERGEIAHTIVIAGLFRAFGAMGLLGR